MIVLITGLLVVLGETGFLYPVVRFSNPLSREQVHRGLDFSTQWQQKPDTIVPRTSIALNPCLCNSTYLGCLCDDSVTLASILEQDTVFSCIMGLDYPIPVSQYVLAVSYNKYDSSDMKYMDFQC
jgi:hypothetical protein